jgi:hypothetical protein
MRRSAALPTDCGRVGNRCSCALNAITSIILDEQPHGIGSTDVLIVGMGRAGTAAYDYLIEQGGRPLGLDNDPAQIEAHLRAGRRVIFGDEKDPELWQEMKIGKLGAVLLITPNDDYNARTTALLREMGFQGPINALIRDESASQPLLEAGATVRQPAHAASRRRSGTGQPATFGVVGVAHEFLVSATSQNGPGLCKDYLRRDNDSVQLLHPESSMDRPECRSILCCLRAFAQQPRSA